MQKMDIGCGPYKRLLDSFHQSESPYTRCPMSRHRTVSVRHRTLLVYEGNQSHVIKNMAARVP